MLHQCSPRRQGGRHCTAAAAPQLSSPLDAGCGASCAVAGLPLPLLLMLEAREALGLRCGCIDRVHAGPVLAQWSGCCFCCYCCRQGTTSRTMTCDT